MKVGNQAPPIALIVKIKNVPNPLTWEDVLQIAASSIPNAVLAAEAEIMIRRRLKKFEKISIEKIKYPAKNNTRSCTQPREIL